MSSIILSRRFMRERQLMQSSQLISCVPNLCLKTTFSQQAQNAEVSKEEVNSENDWFNKVKEGDIDERIVPKPVSVMPDHLPQVRQRIKQKPWWKFRYFVDLNTLKKESSEYTEKPEYPPIFHASKEGIDARIRLEWYNAIRRLPTAEEKIYEITKHYSHLSYILEPVTKQYNSLPISKTITQTKLIPSLPETYNNANVALDENLKLALLATIANRIFLTKSRPASIEFKKSSLSQFGFVSKENFTQSAKEEDIIADTVQVIRNFESSKLNLPHVQIDYNPYVATSWWMNDFPIPFKKKKWFKDNTHFDQCFTYKSTHTLHIRSEYPLKPSLALDDQLCATESEPQPKLNLLQLGYLMKRQNFISLPGFWPSKSEGFDFPYLLGQSREYLRRRKEKSIQDFHDTQDVLDGMAILSSFSWLTSVANNLGFTIYDHLTYPLVTHMVITDGQNWSFYVYQLNQHAFHSDVNREQPLMNICWSSGDLKLFDSYDEASGTFTGVNEDVLKILVKFATAPTQTENGFELRPYLSSNDDRTDRQKEELSYSLRRKFANISDSYIAARKKTNLWEKIYKNHHEAPMDMKRTRPKLEFKYPPFFK